MNTSVVAMKKKGDTMKIRNDFREVSKVLIKDGQPILIADMMFARLVDMRYYLKFDIAKGYWHVSMKPK